MIDPGPPAAHVWLSTDDPRWARRAFARLAVYDRALRPDDFYAYAELFADRWGTAELVAALRHAHRLAPLSLAPAQLLRDLTVAESC